MSFKIIGSMVFKKVFKKCSLTILEPITPLTVTVPYEFIGDVIDNISNRQGKLLRTKARGKK
ncbi:MAG: hypothetical protein AMR96_02825 [Candidatus Adiutrix intracellularis]|nr:MAG: hypothetical protein AMR96_02825 [Candidatus Adiutrix intracellularis]MDR2826446.1 hypothetical protein [Candidatus Adiutrix intracellularis]